MEKPAERTAGFFLHNDEIAN
ncbi:hypothetical protein MESS2_620022 [Mesorhizobium metallidurans STM 2683]|uniref:Uncharacterized protein n=1 Tax=Mesorhizobium metallidurans STM 2683 TaxID=1297569 RepID=M5EUS8_9HYPH|nr:hypothetical protein MESS2_620022 [Mesorhizobium metallidurans STM 2683]